MNMTTILNNTRLIPILAHLNSIEEGLAIAKSLAAAGITILEVTLRTPIALSVIEQVSNKLPEITVGAGTVLDVSQMDQAKNAGAKFLISPGLTEPLIKKAHAINLPYLPGAVTASEVMQAKAMGLTLLKFFPAEAINGVNVLKQFAAVFPMMKFCPTGGINLQNMKNYLSLANVTCVGGSWIPAELIANKDWPAITQLAKQANQQALQHTHSN